MFSILMINANISQGYSCGANCKKQQQLSEKKAALEGQPVHKQ